MACETVQTFKSKTCLKFQVKNLQTIDAHVRWSSNDCLSSGENAFQWKV